MNIILQPEETLTKKGYANHFIEHIGITGTLFLTNTRVCFITHPLNFKKYDWQVSLNDIQEIVFKNNLIIFTHGLRIRLQNGEEHRFAVWRRKLWKAAIEKAIQNLST